MNPLKRPNARDTVRAVSRNLLIVVCVIPSMSGAQEFKGYMAMRLENPVEVTLQISQENGVVIATTTFQNTGKVNSLVKRGYNGFGHRSPGAGGAADSLFDPEFALVCDGKPLRYIGRLAMWARPKRAGFDVIAPGEVIATRHVRLDDVYRFPQSGQACTITHFHLEFDPVSEQVLRVRSLPASFTYRGTTAPDAR